MRILVTGANGYIGRGVVKELLDNGNEVIAVDFKIDDIDKRAIKKECNIFEIGNVYDYFENPDVVLHLAWRDGFLHYSDSHINDLPKHYKFIKDMVVEGVRQVAVLGSMHEIGFYEGCINENTPCNPTTPYGIAKNALRELTKTLCEENNVIFQWLRGYYIVGNTKFGSSIFSKITLAEEKGNKLFPFTSGQNQYDFINYIDFCSQVSIVVSQTEVNGIFNLCSGMPEKLADRVERYIKENNYNIKLDYGAYPDRPYDSKAVWGDNSKILKIMRNDNEK